jgi:hypothetical protein
MAANKSPFNSSIMPHWQPICIEEPFTLLNAAHSIYEERAVTLIKKAFIDGYNELYDSLDLDSFLGQHAIPNSSTSQHGNKIENQNDNKSDRSQQITNETSNP